MYLIINNGNILHITTDKSKIVELIEKTRKIYVDSYNQRLSQGYKMSQALEIEINRHLTGVNVLSVPDTFSIRNVYNLVRDPNPEIINITNEFLEWKDAEIETGRRVTARVVKKGLKSTGKTVVVKSQTGGEVIKNPAQLKALYDQMVRVRVFVEGWGDLTMSPDSLDEYAYTATLHKYKILTILK